jgi:predicted transcriptional regulator
MPRDMKSEQVASDILSALEHRDDKINAIKKNGTTLIITRDGERFEVAVRRMRKVRA